jgi:hypothetical protein
MSATPSQMIGSLSPARLAFSKRDGLARPHYLNICTGVGDSGAGVYMIRKGRVRSLAKDDALGQALFITDLFGIPA